MLITAVTARRHDGSEFIEIKFDDGLESLGGGGVAETADKATEYLHRQRAREERRNKGEIPPMTDPLPSRLLTRAKIHR